MAPWRRYGNLWVCFLASGLWHGAAWTYVIWGAYHGLFLVLDKLFLLRLLDRLPRLVANAFTLLVVMVGWGMFRAHSLGQMGTILAAMVSPGRMGAGFFWRPDLLIATLVGVLICVAPRLPRAETVFAVLLRPAPRAALQIRDAAAIRGGAGPGGRHAVQAVPVFPVLTHDR